MLGQLGPDVVQRHGVARGEGRPAGRLVVVTAVAQLDGRLCVLAHDKRVQTAGGRRGQQLEVELFFLILLPPSLASALYLFWVIHHHHGTLGSVDTMRLRPALGLEVGVRAVQRRLEVEDGRFRACAVVLGRVEAGVVVVAVVVVAVSTVVVVVDVAVVVAVFAVVVATVVATVVVVVVAVDAVAVVVMLAVARLQALALKREQDQVLQSELARRRRVYGDRHTSLNSTAASLPPGRQNTLSRSSAGSGTTNWIRPSAFGSTVETQLQPH